MIEVVLLVFLILLNIILLIDRYPLIGIIVGLFTVTICAVAFHELPSTSIPANPYTTWFCMVLAGINVFINGWELKE